MRILVVDDSAFTRRMIIRMLELGGHEVLQAENGKAALTAIEDHRPDCVSLDLLMPVMDGIDVLRAIRSRGSTLPVIVVSVDIQADVRAECQALGVSAFLGKPPRIKEITACVEKIRAEAEGVT